MNIMQHMHTDNMHMLAPRTGLFLLFCLEFVTAFSAWVPPVGYVPQQEAHWVTSNGKKALLMIYTVHF